MIWYCGKNARPMNMKIIAINRFHQQWRNTHICKCGNSRKQVVIMELTINAWPILSKNYKSKKRIIVNRGGTSSWKTGSLIRLFLLWLISGRCDDDKVFEKWTVSIVRKYGANLRTSVQRDFECLLAEFWLFEKIEINKANRTYQYQNRTIEFIWIDDPQKARWPRRDILYCNEANELSWEDFFQLSVRTWYKIFIDFNPSDEDIWINTELEQKRAIVDKDVDVIVSTYKTTHSSYLISRKKLRDCPQSTQNITRSTDSGSTDDLTDLFSI